MALDARRAEPGQKFGYTDADGTQHELKADDKGVVHVKTQEQANVLDSFGLTVASNASKTGAERTAAATAARKAKAEAKKQAQAAKEPEAPKLAETEPSAASTEG